MKNFSERFPYLSRGASGLKSSLFPLLPLSLNLNHDVSVLGLLDTGSSVNIIPLDVGLSLGAVWDEISTNVSLSGSYGGVAAKALILKATIARFSPVNLAFAWAKTNDIPTILGQVNFFMEFDVCFFRHATTFEVRRRDG